MATDDDKDRQFTTRLRQRLDRYEADVDAQTAARLQTARRRALAAVPAAHPRSAVWLPAGAVATVVVALTIMFWHGHSAVPVPVLAADDWEILVAGELQLIEELDFYDWLAEEDTTG